MANVDIDINFLKQIALDIYNEVSPLLGTQEGAKILKKGVGGDMSMYIDIVAENIVINHLEKNNIDILLISEEVGEKYIGNKENAIANQRKLIVDPIDGSTNSGRGIPFCSVSIAYAIGNTLEGICKAVIIDLITKDIYWAEKGVGAFLNTQKIRVSDNNENSQLIFEIDTSYSNILQEINRYNSILVNLYRVRIMGSLALSLCLLAKGSIDGYLNLRGETRLFDMAAGYLIIKEAGGKIFSKTGENLDVDLNISSKISLMASNAKLEPYLKRELKKINA